MTDLLALALLVVAFIALVFVCALLWTGFRFWRLTGSFESAHKIIDAYIESEAQKVDDAMRAGAKEAHKRGWL